MIRSKKELRFYIMADRLMNLYPAKRKLLERLMTFFYVQERMIDYLYTLRMYEYHKYRFLNVTKLNLFSMLFWRIRFNKLGERMGFSIAPGVLDYGCVIPHYGTIVVGEKNRIGRYAVLHTSTCIVGGGGTIIGDAFYLSSGAKVVGKLVIGNNVSVGANSLLNKDTGNNCLVVGIPASLKKGNYPAWYVRDGRMNKVEMIERIKKELNIQ